MSPRPALRQLRDHFMSDPIRSLRSTERLRRAPRAFTLVELLVVVGIIVLLLGILLAGLALATRKARETQTSSTMNEFKNACDNFAQQFGFYPGLVPEELLAADPQISGTQNALLHLLGGGVRESDVSAADWNDFTSGGDAEILEFGGGTYRIAVDPTLVGRGPRINGRDWPPFYNGTERQLALPLGQLGGSPAAVARLLPTLIDGWGNPIVYLRRARPTGPLVKVNGEVAQFLPNAADVFLASSSFGEAGTDQSQSIISPLNGDVNDANREANLAVIMRHPALGAWDGGSAVDRRNQALAGTARGAFYLISAGKDGIFFAKTDGAGNPTQPRNRLCEDGGGQFFTPSIVGDYDDLVVAGGS